MLDETICEMKIVDNILYVCKMQTEHHLAELEMTVAIAWRSRSPSQGSSFLRLQYQSIYLPCTVYHILQSKVKKYCLHHALGNSQAASV
jgi:hypothetical protein